MAVASLTIVAQAQTEDFVYRPETGAAINDDGTYTVFTGPPIIVKITRADQFFFDSKAAFDLALDYEQMPTVSFPNGLAWRKSASRKEYNHDGQAYAGIAVNQSNEDEGGTISDDQLQRNLVALQHEYEKNIKSGKWHKFVNGE